MAKQTKQQKIDRLMALLRETDAEETPMDFSKVWETTRQLHAPLWNEVAEHLENKASDLKNPSALYLGDHVDVDEPVWFVGSLDGDCGVLPGSVIVQFLDNLKKELGPDPKNAIIMLDPDGLSVARLRDPTHLELDRCLRVMQEHVDEEQKERAACQNQMQHNELVALASSVGTDRALKLLRDAAKGRK